MSIETDPAAPEDTEVTDPPVTEDGGESPDESEDGEGSESNEDRGKSEENLTDSEPLSELEFTLDGEDSAKAEEQPPKDSRAWAKARAEARTKDERIAQLEREAQARSQPATDDPGPEPTEESCEWDRDRYKRDLIAWTKKSEAHEAKKAKTAEAANERKLSWQKVVEAADQSRADVIKRMPGDPEKGVPGYLELESTAVNSLRSAGLEFDPLLAIVDTLEDKKKYPAVIAVLGRDPARLKDLAETRSALRFAAKVSKLEDKVQMKEKSKGKTPPPPEGKPKGTGSGSGAVDHQRERLLNEAADSGNIDKLRAYDKAKRAK